MAALLVVWTHAIYSASYFSASWQASFRHMPGFGACGLDMFFVISGFIVSLVAARAAERNDSSARTFLSRRITRIFPLYWILTLAVIAIAESGRHPIAWDGVSWLPTLFLLPSLSYPAGAPILSLGWSLVFEMYFYFVLAFWMAWTPRHLIRNTMLTLAGMVALGAAVGFRHPLLVIWCNPMVLEFLFGCVVALAYVRAASRPESRTFHRIGAGLAALGAVGLLTTLLTGYGSANYEGMVLNGMSSWLRVGVWGLPSALLVGGAVLWSPAMRSWPARLLVFIGDASYSIYLCTKPTRSAVEHLWRYFGHWGGDVGILLCMAACTLVGILCYLLVERPLMRFFHNWYKQIPFPMAGGN